MNISIFGLGYVGCVTAAILSEQGNNVIGVDVNPQKIDMINKGKTPIIENKIADLISKAVENNKLKATDNAEQAILNTEVSVICVGTPSNDDGSHNLTYLNNVLKQIKQILKNKNQYHLIVIRSTIPPGTTENIIKEYFQDLNIGICFNPEFLREGSAVDDYYNPPYIIVAVNNEKAESLMREFYKGVDGEFITTDFRTAELLKVINNVFHALKIVFANEIKRFSEANNLDSNKIMELVCKDKKLNISSKYLKPGFAFGGSCLPKDLRSFIHLAKQKNIQMPVIENIALSNEDHIQDAIKKITSLKSKDLSFIGLSFKPGTDDLRESPNVRLVEHFIGKGYNIKIYDPFVHLSKLTGANKAFIEKEIPHINKLLCNDLEEIFQNSIIVLTRNEDIEKYLTDKHHIVDLR